MTPRVVIVGAGATGLAAGCELARLGIAIDVVSLAAPRRAVVASSSDAIAAARSDDQDELAAHATDATPAEADRITTAAIRMLVAAGPGMVAKLDALGVAFARDDAGAPLRLRGSGHLRDRLATAGATTKREVVEALDRHLALAARAHPGRVRRLEGWEVLTIVEHGGACVGVVARDLRSMDVHAIPAAAVLLASGGFAGAWGASAAAPSAVGTATAAAVRAGAKLVEASAVDLAPFAIVTRSKRHPISDFVRSAGARAWVPIDPQDLRRGRDVPSKERRDLLRALDDEAGRPASPDASARAIARMLHVDGGGGSVTGIWDAKRGEVEARVYVDVGHLGDALLPEARTEIERLARVTGIDLGEGPARVAPAVCDTLGGLAVGFDLDDSGAVIDGSPANHATSLVGLYAAGSAAHAYHGRSRLPGHRLLEGLVGGELAARAVAAHCRDRGGATGATAALETAETGARDAEDAVRARPRTEAPRELRRALGATLDAAVGAAPAASGALEAGLDDLAARLDACGPDDDAKRANHGVAEIRRLEAALLLARAVVAEARAQTEATPGQEVAP